MVLLDISDDKQEQTIANVLAMSNIDNTEIAVGDKVLYKSFSGNEMEFEGKKYLLIQYPEILAKIVETEKI